MATKRIYISLGLSLHCLVLSLNLLPTQQLMWLIAQLSFFAILSSFINVNTNVIKRQYLDYH